MNDHGISDRFVTNDAYLTAKGEWEDYLKELVAKGEPLTAWERDYYEAYLAPEEK